MDVILTLTKK